MTMKLASSPTRHSSITTRAPASPKAPGLPEHHVHGGVGLFQPSLATTTPLPAARPSALITMGAPCSSR
jgi:hypothetical protein